jgi:oxygen-independent coproporphyrinogen-3 oxidase
MNLALFAESSAPPLRPEQLPSADIEALYVHVPFCFHKCHYCDFYSITRQTPLRMEQFVDRVLAEAAMWAKSHLAPHLRPQTVFFGGGTPSLLPLEQMQRLIGGLRERLELSTVSEWTVEANPATVGHEYCQMLRSSGVDRLSFGAQSFSPAELAILERHHDPADVERSIATARTAGFDRLNVDLIFAIPGQTMESWSRSLEAAIALGTSHISCYALTYEPNTPIAVRRRLGDVRAVDEDLELEMLHVTRERLRATGIPPYEVSNFATPSQECRHNLNYWLGGNYIGLGPSAASHVSGWRWRNRPHLGEWETAIDDGTLPACEAEALTPERRAGEMAMLMLRLERGIRFDYFAARTGMDVRTTFADAVERLTKPELIEVTEESLRLTRAGLNVADAVAAEFLVTN